MLINYACVAGAFYILLQKESKFFGRIFAETVLLPASPLQACNASMAIFQIG